MRIVKTETHRVQMSGLKSGFEEVKKSALRKGLELDIVWISTKDLRTRDSHKSMNGKKADEDGMFVFVSGVNTSIPGGYPLQM